MRLDSRDRLETETTTLEYKAPTPCDSQIWSTFVHLASFSELSNSAVATGGLEGVGLTIICREGQFGSAIIRPLSDEYTHNNHKERRRHVNNASAAVPPLITRRLTVYTQCDAGTPGQTQGETWPLLATVPADRRPGIF